MKTLEQLAEKLLKRAREAAAGDVGRIARCSDLELAIKEANDLLALAQQRADSPTWPDHQWQTLVNDWRARRRKMGHLPSGRP